MHPRTISTLEELRKPQWFSHAGQHDTETAVVLSSWFAAVEYCSSPEWEDLCMLASNEYRQRLAERSPERFRKWNEIVVEVKPFAQALVREKVESVVKEHDLPKVFVDTVDWDILHLCMEAEYADIYPPGFYASQAYWYLNGHFPCGWEGEFPEGKLVIY